ncbi:MAG: hypothetical protein CMG63_04405 [Candidatus Marinimicrobia bacterium]|nr:hypothetical protein [Candidatus Neomarinimicrobiota bacterium]
MNKVIIITSEFPPGPGGIGNHAFNLANQLFKESYDVEVLAPSRNFNDITQNDYDKSLGFEVQRFNDYNLSIITNLFYLKKVYEVLNKEQNCTIICSGSKPLIVGGLFKILFKNKIFFLIAHGLDVNPIGKIMNFIVMLMLNRFDEIISVSKFTREYIPSKNQNKVSIINNGVQIKRIIDALGKNKIVNNLNKDHISLVTLGRISERKGQINVVRLLPQLLKKYPNLHYHMIGIDEKIKFLTSEIKRNKLDDYCTIHGATSDEKTFKLMNKCDIFLMLSNNTDDGDFEGFGIAILEANVLGLPALGSKNSGISDAIIDGKTGYLVDPNNFSEIKGKIEKIIDNYKYFSNQSKKHAYRFSWDNKIDDYVALIDRHKIKS